MKDAVVRMCVAILNFFSVVLICCASGPPETPAKGLLRGFLILCYFGTLIGMNIGDDDDENNRWEDDDLSDV